MQSTSHGKEKVYGPDYSFSQRMSRHAGVCGGLWCVIWRAEHGSIGGASVRLKPREPADASGHESTRFAVVPAGRAAAVFHRAGVRDVLRADRRAGGPGPPP